ncbi:hypothetical protein ACQFX9_25825 [Aliinostoc sp. HNIBRCY26]|uniref:hypothetical protein n=1 Tax=Aliinostoc sp. HNIBRCY26 TaxID=3418997 RepID=UPI003D02A7E0
MLIHDFPDGIPSSEDFFLFEQKATEAYLKAELALLLGGGSSSAWVAVSEAQTLAINSKTIVTATSPITLSFPIGTIGELEIYNASNSKISINLGGDKYQGFSYPVSSIQLSAKDTYTRLIWVDSSNGWIPLTGTLETIGNYPSGMVFWLEGGSYSDRSGSGNNLTPVNASTPPTKAVGIDNKQILRWNGSSNQELQGTPFLNGTSGATLYTVFTVNSSNHYGIVRTQSGLGDYWRFSVNSAGYFGVFRSSRFEAYPLDMPQSGSHLISVHANGTNYEVIQNKVSKGVQSSAYTPGNVFRVGVNDLPFTGDIALILVYPYHISKTSQEHLNILAAIKQFYPSLPFTN